MAIFNTQIKGGGVQPSGTTTITSNGVYDVTSYATADVSVPTFIRYGADIRAFLGEVDTNGILQKPTTPQFDLVFTGVKGFTSYSADMGVFFRRFQNLETIKSVSFPDLQTINTEYAMANAFRGCTGLTSVDLSRLKILSASYACRETFFDCTGITSVDLSSLTTITGNYACIYMFSGCTRLTSIDLSRLTALSSSYACQRMFYNCTGLTSVDLSGLTITSMNSTCYQMFYGCISLATLSFPALTRNFGSYTNQFNLMLTGVTGCTVHFPSNLQSVIGSWTDITAGFGGTNTTVLFDLPATNTLTGVDTVTYTRNPKYDTGTALAWKVGVYGTTNFTPAYYTSGLTDPTVGTTIYSDSACTTAVTTISSIS